MKTIDVIKDVVVVGVELFYGDVDVREKIPGVLLSLLTSIFFIVVIVIVVNNGNLNVQQRTMFQGTIQLV